MKIGIIGAGNLGTGLAKRLQPAGHSVMLSFSRDAAKLRSAADSLGAQTGTPADAAEFADIVILATPWSATGEALRQAGKPTGTKVLWDCTNTLKADMSGLQIGTTTSGGEEVAKLARWARVVKAIPPFAEVLHSSSTLIGGRRPGVFVCGDDAEARAAVSRLVSEIGGEPVDAGPLQLARYTEPAAMLLVQLAYMRGFGARIGLTLAYDTAASGQSATPRD
ncbi:MAG TPA: NAD(P)-binding domain-containing protein [Bryobacteraceae bacterium]|jgi:predicted dinucleotide-binding enzyme|nr:NAD(P)-binding domain-containing protein [Bryobacteraceae bacterium]